MTARSFGTPRSQFPIRKKTNATERKGVGFVRDVVESANCVFKEIDRARDYGHDAFVLLVDGEAVTPVEIALQIKAGRSFCDERSCHFTATAAQLNFWAKHPFLTLGVVYDPDADCCWWVNLRIEARGGRNSVGGKSITFSKNDWNKFDPEGFQQIVLPTLLDKPPTVALQKAIDWATSGDDDTHDLGVRVLLARFRREAATWDAILKSFSARGRNSSFSVFLGLVRIMGHPDEGYFSDEVPVSLRNAVQSQVIEFDEPEVIELLHFVDDFGFERGSPGNGLFALIPRIQNGLEILRSIAARHGQPQRVVENAALMLAIQNDDPRWWKSWTK